MKSYAPKAGEIPRKWYLVDARDQVLGRLASEVANRLRGKTNPRFVPYADTGDFVIVVNADQIRLTGRKLDQKVYYRHTGYIGGLKSITAKKLKEKRPEDLIRFAVRGMLPKNSLGRRQLKKLKVYAGPDHPHAGRVHRHQLDLWPDIAHGTLHSGHFGAVGGANGDDHCAAPNTRCSITCARPSCPTGGAT